MRSRSIAATFLAVVASVAAAGCGGSGTTTDTTPTALSDMTSSTQFQRCAIVAIADSISSSLTGDAAAMNNESICGTVDKPTPLGQSVPDDRLRAACLYVRNLPDGDPAVATEVDSYLNGICP